MRKGTLRNGQFDTERLDELDTRETHEGKKATRSRKNTELRYTTKKWSNKKRDEM